MYLKLLLLRLITLIWWLFLCTQITFRNAFKEFIFLFLCVFVQRSFCHNLFTKYVLDIEISTFSEYFDKIFFFFKSKKIKVWFNECYLKYFPSNTRQPHITIIFYFSFFRTIFIILLKIAILTKQFIWNALYFPPQHDSIFSRIHYNKVILKMCSRKFKHNSGSHEYNSNISK